ncbi:GH16 domain-containing protein [Mycena sanguinolenta]|uniref:GH16 domain-containing protein n=1 Tax=Mycena sanguinolenta TaxID=230812 RepID=A0A8H7CXG8_9AGAR|nr:GH16 domain-containing protein [Mycena sanguinolenta]
MSNPARSGYVPAPHTPSIPRVPGSPSPTSPLPTPGFPRSPNFARSASFVPPHPSFLRKPTSIPPNQRGHADEESSRLLPPIPRGGTPTPSSLSGSLKSLSEKFQLASDPTSWGSDLSYAEPDDALHDPRRDDTSGDLRYLFTVRGFQNVGCVALLAVCILALFMGYPITSHFRNAPLRAIVLHVNSSGQLPNIGNWGLIDLDTPKEMYNIKAYHDPSQTLQLVFSDEFEMDGRTFYPGDDPYWEAVDLHYWQTGDMEWYDPSAITTRGGALEISLTQVDDPSTNHNMTYRSGMMSTWNKFCFTGGLIIANVMLPGINNVFGLWPALWTMGNLGRAGYGATLDGLWPYVYDACDVGTLANQTLNGGPPAALTSGPPSYNGELSYLPGQRLSRWRSAPEIDIFEAQIGGSQGSYIGQVSQSAQWAPFNAAYTWDNTSTNLIIPDPTVSQLNSYAGSVYQQATSVVSNTNQTCYQLIEECYAVQGFEYVPGYDNAYITWITNNAVTWTLNAAGMGADAQTGISARPISQEPMYILANLGMSTAFGYVDLEHLTFPAIMRVDWVRVYQHPDNINIGCDPPDFPTAAYIDTYIDAYTNPNFTTWVDDYKQPNPKNNLIDQC